MIEEPAEGQKEGIMTKEEKTIVYKYRRPAYVIVRYIDIETNKNIVDSEQIDGFNGTEYETEEKEFDFYRIVKEKYPKNAEGKMIVKVTKNEDGREQVEDTIYVEYYYEKLKFNLSVDKKIMWIEANGNQYEYDDNFIKFEFNHDLINTIQMKICYIITVKNTEEIPGSATIEEIIPENMTVNLDENEGWRKPEGNKMYYDIKDLTHPVSIFYHTHLIYVLMILLDLSYDMDNYTYLL